MKLSVLFLLISLSFQAQIFWTEDFGFGCNKGQVANLTVATSTNGAWSTSTLNIPFSNGVTPNQWFISAAEQGQLAGNCGMGCGGFQNRTLHIGTNFTVPIVSIDDGATYFVGSAGEGFTNKRAESPIINCTGRKNIQLSFTYLCQGIVGADFCSIVYSLNGGATWNTLSAIPPSNNSGCMPQGKWTFYSIAMPASLSNNPNVKVGFHWLNNDMGGADPSIAIDEVTLSELTINNQSVIPCPQQTVVANMVNNALGITSYTWNASPNTVTFSAVNSTITTITYGSSGMYTISLLGSAIPAGSVTAKALRIDTVNLSLPLNASFPQTICLGSSATMTASGASSYTWHLQNPYTLIPTSGNSIVVTPAITSYYYVQGTLGSCISNTIIMQVGVSSPVPSVTVNSTETVLCRGQSAILSANGASTYSWNTGGTTQSIVVSPTITTTYTAIGYNGVCSDTISYTQVVSSCTGLNELNNANSEVVFPNPFNNEITIASDGETELIMSNMLGQIVKQEKFNSKIVLNTSELPKGIYFLTLKNNSNFETIKIVKE